ncbi:hypothetical protein GS982_01660 [Rhodococcus hoagii]|uniref:Uncharacterized protein n=1 Tax=Rhodococcus hoagii TaxID=43767 RepID=A0A9Q4ZIL5_RHOHA|nr:hypothetical protein [Prescottella equi]NKT77304.1 hypothetical protein [Prescottella equi]NKZ81091.1 hypothetical protein [Prescottella equi]
MRNITPTDSIDTKYTVQGTDENHWLCLNDVRRFVEMTKSLNGNQRVIAHRTGWTPDSIETSVSRSLTDDTTIGHPF